MKLIVLILYHNLPILFLKFEQIWKSVPRLKGIICASWPAT